MPTCPDQERAPAVRVQGPHGYAWRCREAREREPDGAGSPAAAGEGHVALDT